MMIEKKVSKAEKTRREVEQALREEGKRARAQLLEPNKYSDLKIEIYEFGLSKKVVLGVPSTFGVSNSPDVNFRISQLVANVTQPGMFYIRDFRVANVSCIIGGSVDAYNLKDLRADYPTLTPANRVSATVEYTGLVPDHLKAAPPKKLTVKGLIDGIELALGERDDRVLRKSLKALLDRGPTFEFVISASGYASIVA